MFATGPVSTILPETPTFVYVFPTARLGSPRADR
jgi:hypothetical protein